MKAGQEEEKHIPTEKFAKRFFVQQATVRRSLCIKGHYLGVRPIKLPNGRLLWPNISPEEV